MGDPPAVALGQHGEGRAVLAGVEAHGAGVGAAGVHLHARADRQAGDDAPLTLLLHWRGRTETVVGGREGWKGSGGRGAFQG